MAEEQIKELRIELEEKDKEIEELKGEKSEVSTKSTLTEAPTHLVKLFEGNDKEVREELRNLRERYFTSIVISVKLQQTAVGFGNSITIT